MNFLQALILFLSRIWHSFFRRLSSDFWGSETYSLKFPGKKRLIIPPDIYPLESSAKPDSELKIVLARNQMVRRVDLCTALSFVVHSPFELPGSYGSTDTCDFHFGQDLDILIKPEIIKTDESFRSIDPQKRGCYFQGEKPLNFFQVYTRRNSFLWSEMIPSRFAITDRKTTLNTSPSSHSGKLLEVKQTAIAWMPATQSNTVWKSFPTISMNTTIPSTDIKLTLKLRCISSSKTLTLCHCDVINRSLCRISWRSPVE
jgi:hypothetical protein